MKNIKKTIFTLMASTVLSGATFACPPNTLLDSPYVSAQLGVADKPYSNYESKKFTGRVAYGYLWNPNEIVKLGLETGFNLLENNHYVGNTGVPASGYQGTVKRFGFDILGVLDFYATQRLDLFAKAGPSFTFQKFKYTSTANQPAKSHKDVAALKFAVGVGYDINENTNIYLAREFQTKQNHSVLENSTVPADSTSIGVRYKFC
jgi:hypothetical protein